MNMFLGPTPSAALLALVYSMPLLPRNGMFVAQIHLFPVKAAQIFKLSASPGAQVTNLINPEIKCLLFGQTHLSRLLTKVLCKS